MATEVEAVGMANARGLSVSESVGSLGSTCANSSVGTGTVPTQLASAKKRDMRAELEAWKAQKAAQKSKSRSEAPTPMWQFCSPPKVDPMANLHPPLANGRPPAIPSPHPSGTRVTGRCSTPTRDRWSAPRAPSSERRAPAHQQPPPPHQLQRSASASSSSHAGPASSAAVGPAPVRVPQLQRCSSDPTHPDGMTESRTGLGFQVQGKFQVPGRVSDASSEAAEGGAARKPSCQVGLAARFEAMSVSRSQSNRGSLTSELRESPRSSLSDGGREEEEAMKTSTKEEEEDDEQTGLLGAEDLNNEEEEDCPYNMELDSSVLYIESVLASCLEAYDDEWPEFGLPPPTPITPTSASALAAHRVMQDILREDAPLLPQRVLTVALGRLARLGVPFVSDDDEDNEDGDDNGSSADNDDNNDTDIKVEGENSKRDDSNSRSCAKEECEEECEDEDEGSERRRTLLQSEEQREQEEEREQEQEQSEKVVEEKENNAFEDEEDDVKLEELQRGEERELMAAAAKEEVPEERVLDLDAYLPKPLVEDTLLCTPPPHHAGSAYFENHRMEAVASPPLSRTLFTEIEEQPTSPLPLSPLSLDSP